MLTRSISTLLKRPPLFWMSSHTFWYFDLMLIKLCWQFSRYFWNIYFLNFPHYNFPHYNWRCGVPLVPRFQDQPRIKNIWKLFRIFLLIKKGRLQKFGDYWKFFLKIILKNLSLCILVKCTFYKRVSMSLIHMQIFA